jgi:hypothetical protein
MKKCKGCHTNKSLDQFYKHQYTKDGRRGKCIECWLKENGRTPEQNKEYRAKNLDRIRAYDRERAAPEWKKKEKAVYDRVWRRLTAKELKNNTLKRTFGITLDQYNSMLEQQRGLCAICFHPEKCKSISGGQKALSVDHCHKSGIVRGLLCDRCNRGMGLLRDDPSVLKNAINYLERIQ